MIARGSKLEAGRERGEMLVKGQKVSVENNKFCESNVWNGDYTLIAVIIS